MSILFATTAISLLSPSEDDLPDSDDDWGGAPSRATGYTPTLTGIRAHLSAPSGNAAYAQEGSGVAVQYRLICDPVALVPAMLVRDDGTGEVYQVDWCLTRPEPLAHTVAGISKTSGSS